MRTFSEEPNLTWGICLFLHAEDSKIGLQVRTDEFCVQFLAVRGDDLDLGGAVNDVVVGNNEAVFGNEEARAEERDSR